MARQTISSQPTSEAAPVRSLCLFASPTFLPRPLDVQSATASSTPGPDGDVALARAERALRARHPGHRAGRGRWARPAEPLFRALRLHLHDAEDAADEVVLEIEQLARRLGLGLLDESLEEVVFPTTLERTADLFAATRALLHAGDGYLCCEGGPEDAHFVQALAASSEPWIEMEAVGNRVLAPAHRLSRRQRAELRRRGWAAPSAREPNYRLQLRTDLRGAPERLARLVRETLGEVYGIAPGAQIVLCLGLG